MVLSISSIVNTKLTLFSITYERYIESLGYAFLNFTRVI